MVMVLAPTLSGMLAVGWPDVAVAPFTLMVAFASVVVAVTVNEVIELTTLSVMVAGTVAPCERPALVFSNDKVLIGDTTSVTTMV